MHRAVNEGSDGIWAQAGRAANWLLTLICLDPLFGGETSSNAPLKIRFHFPVITNIYLTGHFRARISKELNRTR